MILGRSSKPRSRASIACAGCRARRTKCIIAEGQTACDRCCRLGRTCVLRNDDERRRPVTKAQVHALVRRIGTLEQSLSNAGLVIPPAVEDHDSPTQRRASMREDMATAAAQGSVVTAAALVAAATGHGRGLAAQAVLRARGSSVGEAEGESMSPQPQPPTLPQANAFGGTDETDEATRQIHGVNTGMLMLEETDSPLSTAATSSTDMAASAVYPGESVRRQRLRVGSMSLGGPGGHSRYIGITTNYHIYSNMYHAEKEEVQRECENHAARTRALLANIPYDAHQHLIHRFWTRYNTIIHIVHRKAFELGVGGEASGSPEEDGASNSGHSASGMWGAGLGSGRYYSPFLHVCMLAVGFRYADRTRPEIQAFATHEGESLLHEEAKRLVDHELKMPGGVPSLQALLLLGDLECGVGRYNTGWLYAGMACRLIFDLGLNRQCGQSSKSRLDMEVRRTVLWGCVVLDRFWGLFLGRPTSIKMADISIPNGPSQPHLMQGCLPMGPQFRLETEIYEALINLTDTASKLTDSAHRHYTTSDPSAYYFVTGLHRELRSWYRQLPRHLQWTSANLARNPPSAFFNLHQQYHTMFILIYRPFLSGGKALPTGTHNTGGGLTNGHHETVDSYSSANGGNAPYVGEDAVIGDGDDDDDEDDGMGPELGTDIVSEMARKTCFTHAVKVARIYEAFCARFECRSMFVTGMQHAATAAFAIVEGLATQSTDRQVETLLHLQRLAEALYAHASVYYPARVMSNILFRVLGEYRDSHAQRGGQQSEQAQPLILQNQTSQTNQTAQTAQTTPPTHHHHQLAHHNADLAHTDMPMTPAPAWSSTPSTSTMMQPPSVLVSSVTQLHTQTAQPTVTSTSSGGTDWTGLMHGSSDQNVLGSSMIAGAGAGGFVDFEFDTGIWESIMNTLSQPLDLGV